MGGLHGQPSPDLGIVRDLFWIGWIIKSVIASEQIATLKERLAFAQDKEGPVAKQIEAIKVEVTAFRSELEKVKREARGVPEQLFYKAVTSADSTMTLVGNLSVAHDEIVAILRGTKSADRAAVTASRKRKPKREGSG